MAEATAEKSSSLAEQYFVKEKEEKTETSTKPLEVKEVEVPKEMASQEAVAEKTVEAATAAASLVNEESIELAPAAEESAELDSDSSEGSINATTEQSSEKTDEPEAAEETPEIKLETAPADFRFPTTNQTRHCFTRYVEYHRCIAAKGEGAPECDKFAKYYRSLCPGEWIDRWNEQRENGTFPGPL
ncbi:cytochrome c oxidase subunit 6b-1-like [Prosopis cineraria]|uniref:cytochrome c oxidase subunit 6b-1-like n=1 Tax=Prosopis cineraria TaxID=364024 RepID=UPI00240EF0FC|nr:cytochrome c oxidase subunit 6b-1-like [Prosopis cineraria]